MKLWSTKLEKLWPVIAYGIHDKSECTNSFIMLEHMGCHCSKQCTMDDLHVNVSVEYEAVFTINLLSPVTKAGYIMDDDDLNDWEHGTLVLFCKSTILYQ
jgi:hypothetical protein